MDINDLKNFGKSKPKYKIFKHQPPLFLVSDSEWGETFYTEKGRYYQTPDKNCYPSVTTFLKYFQDDTWLVEWRNKVGDEEADRISKRSSDRGTAIHDAMDHYVNNSDKFDINSVGQFRFMLNQIRRVVDRKLDSVFYTEHALFSNKLKLAGRCDLGGIWSGYTAIIDYKNKNYMAKREDITDYFIQAATYAIMHMEMYGSLPEKLVILIAVDDPHVIECQVFEEWTKDWVQKVISMARVFKSESGYHDLSNQNRFSENPNN